MANKIVQLTDDNGDNIFPVSVPTAGNNWFTIVSTATSGKTSYTSPSGKSYETRPMGSGTGLRITAGGADIKMVKAHISAVFSAALTTSSPILATGFASNSSYYVRTIGGISSGTAITASQTSGTISSSSNAVSTGITLGKLTGVVFDYTAIRRKNSPDQWTLFGRAWAHGIASAVDFDFTGVSLSSTSVPSFCCDGLGSVTVTTTAVLEILESD